MDFIWVIYVTDYNPSYDNHIIDLCICNDSTVYDYIYIYMIIYIIISIYNYIYIIIYIIIYI